MKGNLTTLGHVWDRVEELSKHCHDALVPVKDISFEQMGAVRIGSEVHPMRDIAQREVAYRLGIPIPYLRKCPPDIQALNLNHWLGRERNEQLFFRFDGEEVRAVFTPRYRPVDNFEVLERLDSHGFGHDTEVQCHLDREFMLLNIPDGSGDFVLKGNDRMRPGFSIGNSEVGVHSLRIAAFILRLVCTNGMIGTTDVAESYKHVSTRILEEFPKVLARVTGELGKQKERFRISLDSMVDDPEATMRSFNARFQLGQAEKEAVEWAWPQEAGDNMFSIVNTYTKSAQHPDLTAEGAYRLQKVGGTILGMVG